MPTLTITRGFPGSGKSTWAKKQYSKTTVGVNRDLLRMMTGGKWWPANEHLVTDIQTSAIEAALARGLNVIVDDTFLNDKYVEQMRQTALRLNADFVVNDSFLSVPITKCIERDAARERSVGKDVIVRMYYEYWAQRTRPDNAGSARAILVDIDGTLAHVPGRTPFAHGGFPYERNKTHDTVDLTIRGVLGTFASMYEYIILLSGRDGADRADTETWLAQNGVPYHQLLMRAEGDDRPDTVVKKELYMNHVQGKWRVDFVIDDRPSVVRMWRAELGLPVFNVGFDLEF